MTRHEHRPDHPMNSFSYLMRSASLIALLACSGCKDSSAPSHSNPNSSSSTSSGNPVTAPVDYLGAVNQGQKSATKTLSLVGVTQAIQAYQASEGKLPRSLQDLVTAQLLPKLPEPPRGMKFHYDPATGDVKLVPQ